MWTVRYVEAAETERKVLDDRERAALYNAVEKLKVLGPDLPYPHSSNVEGPPGSGSYGPARDAAGSERSTDRSVADSSTVPSDPKRRSTREDSGRRAATRSAD